MKHKLPHFGILQKILISFLAISLIPLLIFGYIGGENLRAFGLQAIQRTAQMGRDDLSHTSKLGDISIKDSVRALDIKSTEAIELRTVELAHRIADFLHERDNDILMLSTFAPSSRHYLAIYNTLNRDVIATDSAALSELERMAPATITSSNPENSPQWRHTPPLNFKRVARPLYKEITFVDLQGHEQIKVANGRLSANLIDVTKAKNTYCKAEDYFRHVKLLKKGEIYVSNVVGAYVKGWIRKTPEGISVRPDSAYAGKENPQGKKFEGIIRWATPVYAADKRKIGYLTMALDHTHVMEFTDHIKPTEERFTALSDGGSGNYAWLWDNRDRNISHPRDFFICGYNPDTGKEVPGWVSQDTYDEYRKSQLSLEYFTTKLPSFRAFTHSKLPSAEQIKAGTVSLDCRILDTASQCEGWHEGTEDGGSGSFVIFWSGLWKLTTYAAVPYYTGQYGKSRRGFGYVTVGANVDEFHKDANITKAKIEAQITKISGEMGAKYAQTQQEMGQRVTHNRKTMALITVLAVISVIIISCLLSRGIIKPLKNLTDGARAMSRGNLDQSIEVKSNDEIGQLSATFNEMARSIASLDKMKSDFVTIASHELRTPIQAMLLSISGILEGYSGKIDAEVREDLQLAIIGIERLMRLVNNLLNLSRIEARITECTMTSVPIEEIVELAIVQVSDLLYAHRHVISRKIQPGLLTINGDKDQIVQVLINLLSNAIKYNPAGGRIHVGVEQRGGYLQLFVADNGYGVPPWAKEDIFKKFFQADNIMSHKVGGSGLGLTISKGIVENHNGTITCKSPIPDRGFTGFTLGGDRKGSIFIISLPATNSAHLIC